MLDDLAEFAARLPAWCGPDGLPLSWRHWVIGMPYLTRARMRDRLDTFTATAAASASEQAAQRWIAGTTRGAGWAS